jgi:endonuclease YncB( thermonuclease family)
MIRYLVLVGLLLQAGQILADTIEGRVVGVSDGDTITLLDSSKTQHKIRLQGIDAPEAKQAFGQASKRHLSNLVFNRDVTAECGKTDKYKRQVCVMTVSGQDANLAQVKAGMAWWYRAYAKEQIPEHRAQYQGAEMDAQRQRLGLWRDAEPVPPWEWRKAKREN